MQKTILSVGRKSLAVLTMGTLMIGTSVFSLAAFTSVASAAVGPTPAPAPAPCDVVGTPFLTLTQPITEPDSGTGGNWANDTLTENVNVWVGTDHTTFCANGNTTNGTFTTTGPHSPQASAPLASGITGTFTGGETWVLPAGTATTTSASSLTLAADNSSAGSQFNNWQSQVFNATGQGVGASTYAFTYVTANNGTWTNADPASGSNRGDIIGVSAQSSVTVAATNVTSTDATLNGTNGDVAANNTGLWVATSTFSTTSTTPPPGVYTETLPGAAANAPFSAELSSVAGLPAITPNTTYYFAAWTEVDGTWTPGAVLQFTTSAVVTTAPTTAAATSVTSTGATLNGANGDTAATDSSFWVATSTFSTASSAALPSGVFSTPSLGALAPNAAFSSPLSSVAGVLPITPNTTYYYAAWSNIGGTWQPGAVSSFTTGSAVAAAPVVSSVSPSVGTTAGGTVVTITGTGFTGETSVTFGTTSATGIVVNSDSSITATSPATTTEGTTDIMVTTPLGTSAINAGDQFVYSASSGSIGGTVTGGPGVLAVTSITPVQTSAVSDNTYADGWSYIFNVTVPTNEPNLSMSFANWLAADSNTIPVADNMQISSAQALASTTPVTLTAANVYSSPLDMVGDLSTTTPGLQVQVLVQVKIPLNTANDSYTTNYGVQTLH